MGETTVTSRKDLVWPALAAVVVHVMALKDGFTTDDFALLVENPFVRDAAGLRALVSHELFVASGEPRPLGYYRPLSGAMNWLSFQLVGASAPLQHAWNIVLGALVACLLTALLRAWGVRRALAVGAGVLIAIHPACSEVIAYVQGRQDLAGAAAMLASLLFATRVKRAWQLAPLAFAGTLVGGAFHELFAMTGLLVALFALHTPAAEQRKRAGLALGGFLAAIATAAAVRHGLALQPLDHRFSPDPLRLGAGVALRFLHDTLLPIDLAFDVSVDPEPWWSTALVTLAGIGGSIALLRATRRRAPHLFGPLVASLTILVLVVGAHTNVLSQRGEISDRYAFGAVLAFTLLLALALELAPPVSPALARFRLVPPLLVSVALVPLTLARDLEWKDEHTLLTSMVDHRPDDPESKLAKAMLLAMNGDGDAAYPLCREYHDARPRSPKPALCIGLYLLKHHHPYEAGDYLVPYAKSHEGAPVARRAALAALAQSGRKPEAKELLARWEQMFPDAAELVEARAALGP